jgi:hypothetical protein
LIPQQQTTTHLPSSPLKSPLVVPLQEKQEKQGKERASAAMASKLAAIWNHPAGPKTSEPLFFLSPSLWFCPLAACYKSHVLSLVTSIELGIDCFFGK